MRTGSPSDKRFAQSALLFRFCHAVLQIRQNNTKTHDQIIGNILNYNASDTSHWKRGKKSVKSIYALEALAKNLEVDFEILQDISDGSLDFDEAWFEFSEAEQTKQHTNTSVLNSAEALSRQVLIEKLAQQILTKANITTCPIFVPEIISEFPFIEIISRGINDKLARAMRIKPGKYAIHCRKGDMRPHTRVAVIREFAKILLQLEREQLTLPPRAEEFLAFEINAFTNALLVPETLLQEEFQKIPLRKNAIKDLANIFWVSKSVIRSRVHSILVANIPENISTSKQYVVRKNLISSQVNNISDYEEEDDDNFIDNDASSTQASLQ